ncbi:MAG: polysaccharide pyruvyl transferase CsaB [Vampirovibrio sp.]|jgi:polysaccharide pyruvyl transferase CsaB|nr:polysaccharide pyruvyl transferase CsaB [Vampirovibrio sp.]
MKTPFKKPALKKKFPRKKGTSDLHPRVIISGYYGFDNLGDELILRVLIEQLKAHQVKITVLSQNPRKTAETYGVDAVKRTSFIDIVDALTQANLFISGGGGLFQDATGPMSTVYYGGLIHLARFFEVPVCFWAQGVGPLNKDFSRKMTASALKKCEVITVRDEKSAALVESLTGEEPEITADPVWLLNVSKKKGTVKKGTKKDKQSEPWRIGVSLRHWPELTDERLKALANCLIKLAEPSERPVEFLLMPFQKEEDTHLLEKLSGLLKGCPNAIAVILQPDAVLDRIADCNVLLGMRFHSLILGLLFNVPVYGLVYDPKVASLLEMFDLQGCRIDAMESIDAPTVQDYFTHYPKVDLKAMKQQSRRNFRILNRLLQIPDAELVL